VRLHSVRGYREKRIYAFLMTRGLSERSEFRSDSRKYESSFHRVAESAKSFAILFKKYRE